MINDSLPIKGVKNIKPLDISDFLSLFKNASFVFTASYHGMLFSIYCNKDFAYYNRAHRSRMKTLAARLDVLNRDGNMYDVLSMQPIQYSKVNRSVTAYRDMSVHCLKSFLEK